MGIFFLFYKKVCFGMFEPTRRLFPSINLNCKSLHRFIFLRESASTRFLEQYGNELKSHGSPYGSPYDYSFRVIRKFGSYILQVLLTAT